MTSKLVFSLAQETIETYLDYIQSVSMIGGDVGTIATGDMPQSNVATVTGGLITPQMYDIEATSTYTTQADTAADADFWIIANGVGLGKAVVLDFEPDLRAGDPFEAGQYSKIDAVLTQAGAGAQVRISLAELVQNI